MRVLERSLDESLADMCGAALGQHWAAVNLTAPSALGAGLIDTVCSHGPQGPPSG
jgi:hypothetical protein